MTGDPPQRSVFIDPDSADLEIAKVGEEWLIELHFRGVSHDTIRHKHKALLSFLKSLRQHNKLCVLSSITRANVEAWCGDLDAVQREKRRRELKADPYLPPCLSIIPSTIDVLTEFATEWLQDNYTDVNLLTGASSTHDLALRRVTEENRIAGLVPRYCLSQDPYAPTPTRRVARRIPELPPERWRPNARRW